MSVIEFDSPPKAISQSCETTRREKAAHGECFEELRRTLLGNSPAMVAIRKLIAEVAPTRVSVLIYGESGTGKELVAQTIHRFSKLASGPFIPVNIATIPPGQVETLLFGHEKIAVADDIQSQQGCCEAADGGTLFLDEVADLEVQAQPKLLRLLQEGTLQRVGSQELRRVVVRVIGATSQDPEEIVANGRMREDLFFRMHIVPIHVPALRDRPEDIPELAMMFLRRSAQRHDRPVERFSEDAFRVLQQHDWPGNIRQLENTVERLVVFSQGPVIEADQVPLRDDLAAAFAERRRITTGVLASGCDDDEFNPLASLKPIERHERAAIVDALRRADGHVTEAARLLGLGQATIYRKIKQYAIPYPRKRRRPSPK